MGGGLLKHKSEDSPDYSYSEIFDEMCPYYLSIGMTYEEYWDKDCYLVKYYRKAEERRLKQKNYDAWLSGMYIYDAISRLYPLFNPYAKKGTKVKPYPSEPYPMDERDENKAQDSKEKEAAEKGITYLNNFASKFNEKFKKEGGEN